MADKNLYENQIEQIRQSYLGSVELIERDKIGCPIVWVKSDQSIELLRFLKEQEGFEYRFLADLTAYDNFGTPEESKGRFVVVYNLYSPQNKNRIRVKVRVAEGAKIRTTVSLWSAADWAEREVYDMFGVKFEGHPDLRRILMDERWDGHPLRKEYPLRRYQLFVDPEPMPEHLLKN